MFNDTLKPFGNITYTFNNICEDDSFYYISGSVNNAIVKMDKQFNIVNRKSYNYGSFYYICYPYNSTVLVGNKVVLCAQAKDTTGLVFGVVVELNKYSLDTNWIKSYSHPDTVAASQPGANVWSELTAIKPTPDGGYILTGNYNKNCVTGNLRSFLMKIDSLGNVEWRRTYNSYYTFFDIEAAADSGYFVPCTLNGGSIYLVKFDKYGLYAWKVKVNSNNYESYPISVSKPSSNNIIVSSSFWYDATNYLRAVTIASININTGTITWEKNYFPYKSFECISLHQAMGVETLPNGDIIVSGTADRYGYDAVILKLNSNGDSLWCKSYDYEPDTWGCQLNDLLICDDGGFLGVGFFEDHNTGSTAWMFKTDANGVVGWESPKPKIRDRRFKLYPNPALDYTTLKYNCKYENLSYEISDMQGRALVNKPLETIEDVLSNEVLIDLQGLSPGNYHLVIRTNDMVLWNSKLIITE